jgi:hypothetical protein
LLQIAEVPLVSQKAVEPAPAEPQGAIDKGPARGIGDDPAEPYSPALHGPPKSPCEIERLATVKALGLFSEEEVTPLPEIEVGAGGGVAARRRRRRRIEQHAPSANACPFVVASPPLPTQTRAIQLEWRRADASQGPAALWAWQLLQLA